MASRRITAQQVLGLLFESSSDHGSESESDSDSQEAAEDSGSEFSLRMVSSDDDSSSSADEVPVVERDIDVPVERQEPCERQPRSSRFPFFSLVRNRQVW